MRWPFGMRPSAGVVLVVVLAFACAVFFAWGLSPPRVDEAWRLELELELGDDGLSESELALVQGTLADYPEWADSLVEGGLGVMSANDRGVTDSGYAYVVRREASERVVLAVTRADPTKKKPVQVRARTVGREAIGVAGVQPFTWELPDDGPFPQLVEVRVLSGGKRPPAIVVTLASTPR